MKMQYKLTDEENKTIGKMADERETLLSAILVLRAQSALIQRQMRQEIQKMAGVPEHQIIEIEGWLSKKFVAWWPK